MGLEPTTSGFTDQRVYHSATLTIALLHQHQPIHAECESASLLVRPAAANLLLRSEAWATNFEAVLYVVRQSTLCSVVDFELIGEHPDHARRQLYQFVPHVLAGIQNLHAELQELSVASRLWALVAPAGCQIPEPNVALLLQNSLGEYLTSRRSFRSQAKLPVFLIWEHVHLPQNLLPCLLR